MKWTAHDVPSQLGRRVVITGASSGIGFETALSLARHGAEIVLPARTEEKSAEAIRRIRADVRGAALTPMVLDLASLESVRTFAELYRERFPGQSLDLLINNAGVMALPTREVTADGFERQFATNFLGPFAFFRGVVTGSTRPSAAEPVQTGPSSCSFRSSSSGCFPSQAPKTAAAKSLPGKITALPPVATRLVPLPGT